MEKVKMVLISFFIVMILMCSTVTISSQNIQSDSFDDQLDQSQVNVDTVNVFYGNISFVQSFRPAFPKLMRVELFLARYGDFSGDVRVCIKDSRTSDTVLAEVVVSADVIPRFEPEWILFDVGDVDVEIDESYYICCETVSGDEDHYFLWYGTNLDGYERGLKYVTVDGGVTWEQRPNDDCAFKTYGAGPILDIIYVIGDSTKNIQIGIRNKGTLAAESVKVTSSFEGGLLFTRWFEYEFNGSLAPGHELRVDVSPVIGFGPTTLYIDVWSENANSIEMENIEIFLLFYYIYVISLNP